MSNLPKAIIINALKIISNKDVDVKPLQFDHYHSNESRRSSPQKSWLKVEHKEAIWILDYMGTKILIPDLQ
jgi:hypothetical protein